MVGQASDGTARHVAARSRRGLSRPHEAWLTWRGQDGRGACWRGTDGRHGVASVKKLAYHGDTHDTLARPHRTAHIEHQDRPVVIIHPFAPGRLHRHDPEIEVPPNHHIGHRL